MEIAALLAAATLFGGMTLYSFGFAPLLFTRLPGEQAARLLREAFPWYYLFVIVTAGVAGLLVVALDPFSAALLAATLLVGVIARQLLMPAINRARDASLGKRESGSGGDAPAGGRENDVAVTAEDAPVADGRAGDVAVTAEDAPVADGRAGDVPLTDAMAADGEGRAMAKRRFDRLHGLSVALNFAQLAAVGWVLARFV